MKNIAFFISEHGFGHASRATSIINKLLRYKKIHIIIFSNIPKWFFDKSIIGNFELFIFPTDVGLVQDNPFKEDLDKTLENLEQFYFFQDQRLGIFCEKIRAVNVELIICDISPIGMLVAKKLGVRSVLIENFTWDWIYEPYLSSYSEFGKYIEIIKKLNSLADFHFQTTPICNRNEKYLLFPPIFREKRHSREDTRRGLGVPLLAKLVLVTMGGIPISVNQITFNFDDKNTYFVIPGSDVKTQITEKNKIFLPHDHNFFHPDLVHASDIVIGKVGYSTIAEVYSAQVPFLYIPRENFRESIYLEKFIQTELIGVPIKLESLMDGTIKEDLQKVLDTPKKVIMVKNGADMISILITENLL